MDDAQYAALRHRIEEALAPLMKDAYSDFPIDEVKAQQETLDILLTRSNICAALIGQSLKSGETATGLQAKYKRGLGEGEAKQRGIVSSFVKPHSRCSSSLDWSRASASYRTDIKNCDGFQEIASDSMIITALYAVGGSSPPDIYKLFADTSKMHYYASFAEGPMVCSRASNSEEVFFRRNIPAWRDLQYVLNTSIGPHGMIWRLSRRCGSKDIESDLDYNFGGRAAVPIYVSVNAQTEERILVIKQAVTRETHWYHRPPRGLRQSLILGVELLQKCFLENQAGSK